MLARTIYKVTYYHLIDGGTQNTIQYNRDSKQQKFIKNPEKNSTIYTLNIFNPEQKFSQGL